MDGHEASHCTYYWDTRILQLALGKELIGGEALNDLIGESTRLPQLLLGTLHTQRNHFSVSPFKPNVDLRSLTKCKVGYVASGTVTQKQELDEVVM